MFPKSPIARVSLALLSLVLLIVGAAFAVRTARKSVPPAYVVDVKADDFSPPPIQALPATEEQAQAWLRNEETWPIEPLVREDLFGMRFMWLQGYAAACERKDTALLQTYVTLLGASRDWVRTSIACPLTAAVSKPDAAHAQIAQLYARAPKGVWFDAVRPSEEDKSLQLRAFYKGKRFSVFTRSEPDEEAARALLKKLEAY